MRGKAIVKKVLSGLIILLSIWTGLHVAYPRLYRAQVEEMSTKYEVDPLFIYAIIKTESKFNTNAISKSGAKGLMQIMDGTGQWGAEMCGIQEYSKEKLFDPCTNIEIGCWYISKLLKQYEGNIDLVLAAYNAGSGNVARWRENKAYSSDGKNIHTIPFKETDNYLKRVKKNYSLYKGLYTN